MSRAFAMTFASDESSSTNAHHVDDITQSVTTVCDNTATSHTDVTTIPAVGDKADVFWPLHNELYFGIVAEEQDGSQTSLYDDVGIKTLNFSIKIWCYVSSAKLLSSKVCSICFKSDALAVLEDMLYYFGNWSFMRYQAQAFPNYGMKNAYLAEEADFIKTVRAILLAQVPSDTNIIASHTVYKVKTNGDQSLKLKARIAPSGNEDSYRDNVCSDCSICPPSGFRIVASIVLLHQWRVANINVKTAFLRTGDAQRHVYVIPSAESDYRNTCL